VAEGMNRAEKIVFSNTLKTAGWSNARVVNGDIVEATREMKAAGKNLTLLGSGSILTAFAEAGLIDRYEIMVNPVAIGAGTSLFEGLERRLALELIDSRVFESGAVLLRYRPADGG
ncbi:MAG: dihydrofolate reductase family protein, partial [Gammaproteobacteria bacterium]